MRAIVLGAPPYGNVNESFGRRDRTHGISQIMEIADVVVDAMTGAMSCRQICQIIRYVIR